MSLLGSALGAVTGPYRLYAELAVVAALMGAVGVQTMRMDASEAAESTAKAETDSVRAKWAIQSAQAASAALAASEQNRQIAAELQRTKEEADHVRQTEREAAAAAAAGFAAERDGMRRSLARYAAGPAGGGGAAVDSLASCSLRAAALGDGLASTLRAEEDVVGELELSRADTRSLLDAWPHAPLTP